MKQTISVDKAINRGHLMVNLPVMIALIGCPGLAVYLNSQNKLPGWSIAIAAIIGFGLAWLIWSIMITKWRIWAFENVRNVHELKKRAIREKLIWDDDNIFEKTEIRSKEDKKALDRLQRKFDVADDYREDYSVPPKTEIYYSKTYSIIELVVSVAIIGVGIRFILKMERNYIILGSVLLIIGLLGLIKEVKKVFNKKPVIILDRYGIATKNVGFREWDGIHHEQVVTKGIGRNTESHFDVFLRSR